jgi:hypothetical protein
MKCQVYSLRATFEGRSCGACLELLNIKFRIEVGPSELSDRINHFKKKEADFRLRTPILTLKSQTACGCYPRVKMRRNENEYHRSH